VELRLLGIAGSFGAPFPAGFGGFTADVRWASFGFAGAALSERGHAGSDHEGFGQGLVTVGAIHAQRLRCQLRRA